VGVGVGVGVGGGVGVGVGVGVGSGVGVGVGVGVGSGLGAGDGTGVGALGDALLQAMVPAMAITEINSVSALERMMEFLSCLDSDDLERDRVIAVVRVVI
jgi:hypothetical protein